MDAFCRYLPIDEELFSSPLFLTGAGRSITKPGESYPSPGHPDLYNFNWQDGRILPEFSLLWIETGAGIWQTRDGVFKIQSHQVGQVFSGHWHRYKPDPKVGWIECWLQFNGRLVHELMEHGFFHKSIPVRSPVHPALFARQFLELLDDISSPHFVNNTSQGLRVAGLLGLLETPAKSNILKVETLIDRARRHIWSHSHRQLDVNEIAQYLRVSRRTLERSFAAHGKNGILEEISLCRMHRAERLLRETKLPVRHVVNLAGFGTTEQMRQHFHAAHNLSPAQYRRAVRHNCDSPSRLRRA